MSARLFYYFVFFYIFAINLMNVKWLLFIIFKSSKFGLIIKKHIKQIYHNSTHLFIVFFRPEGLRKVSTSLRIYFFFRYFYNSYWSFFNFFIYLSLEISYASALRYYFIKFSSSSLLRLYLTAIRSMLSNVLYYLILFYKGAWCIVFCISALYKC